MKTVHVAAGLVLLFGAGTIVLWLALDGAPVRDDVVVAESEAPADPAVDEARLEEPGGSALLEDEDRAEGVAREEIAPPPPPTAAVASDAPAAPVRGTVRDAATGEPLPGFLLRVEQAGERRAEVTTDETGRFATAEAIQVGPIRIHALDHRLRRRSPPAFDRVHEVRDGAPTELDLAVPSGPTYRLALAPVGSFAAADLEARLRVVSDENRSSTPLEPVREGNPAWVRFTPIQAEFERAAAIEVRSRDGLWTGEAAVSAVRGVVPGVVALTLEARAVLAGRLTDAEGTPIQGANVALEGTTLAGARLQRSASTDSDGRYRLDYVRAGNGVVTAWSVRHAVQEAPVVLSAAQVAERDFSLLALPPAGAIRGVVRSETGTYRRSIRVVLGPTSDKEPGFTEFAPIVVQPSWETVDGRLQAEFEFPALPAGRFQVSMRGDGWLEWEPRRLVASPPTESVSFLVRDDVSLADFFVRVRDADNGAPITSFHVTSSGSPGLAGAVWGNDEVRLIERFPLDRRFRWRVDRYDYRPAWGDEAEFSRVETRDGRVVRIADVALRPGWGDLFRVVQRGNNRPIEGATILLDGRPAGTTGKDGTAKVDAPRKPDRVEVTWKDWRVAGAIDLRPAWKRDDKQRILVRMAPPPPKKPPG